MSPAPITPAVVLSAEVVQQARDGTSASTITQRAEAGDSELRSERRACLRELEVGGPLVELLAASVPD